MFNSNELVKRIFHTFPYQCGFMGPVLKTLDKTVNIKGGKTITPEELNTLYLLLTYKCNLKCIICDTWKLRNENPAIRDKELTFSEIKHILKSSKYLKNVNSITLGGAEPMLREDFVDIVTFIIKDFPCISLGTGSNGFATELIVSKILKLKDNCDLKNFYMGFSLDGIGKLHDRIRGINGAFERLVNTITQLRITEPGIKLCLTFTITPINYTQLMDVFEFSKRYEMEFGAQFLIPEQGRLELCFNDKQIDKIEKMIKKIIADKYNISPTAFSYIYYISKLTAYEKNRQRIIKNCGAGSLYTFITPYGDVVFCPKQENYLQRHIQPKFVIGNIRNANFDEIWLSQRALEMRSWITGNHCSCWLLCSSMPTLGKIFSLLG